MDDRQFDRLVFLLERIIKLLEREPVTTVENTIDESVTVEIDAKELAQAIADRLNRQRGR